MTQETYITPDLINRAAQLGACEESLAWLRAEPRTQDQAVARYPDWWLRKCAGRLTDVQFDRAAQARPMVALVCCADRLTDVQFDLAAQAEPWTALVYCADRLTQRKASK